MTTSTPTHAPAPAPTPTPDPAPDPAPAPTFAPAHTHNTATSTHPNSGLVISTIPNIPNTPTVSQQFNTTVKAFKKLQNTETRIIFLTR
jgi:hypothetical protein